MEQIRDRLFQIDNQSGMLNESDRGSFVDSNTENFNKINLILSNIEKSLQLYTIPEDQISAFNRNEERHISISGIMFPIYWALYQKYLLP